MTDLPHERDPVPAGSRFVLSAFGEQWRWLPLALVVWLAAVGFMMVPLVRPAVLVGPDSFYHVAISGRMAEQGLVLHEYPWVTESTWVERYFDKEWLFHVILAPVSGPGAVLGPKLVILALNGLIALAFWRLCLAVGVRRPLLWALALPFVAGPLMVFRLSVVRPQVFSFLWLFLVMAAMFRRRGWLVAVFTAIYSLSHASHWVVPAMVLAYDVLYGLLEDDGRRRARIQWLPRMTLWAVGGFVLGTLIHPQFPHNVSGLWLQNVEVLSSYWSAANDLQGLRPRELAPLGIWTLIYCAPLVVATAALAPWAWTRRARLDRTTAVLLIFGAGYTVLAVRSMRFVDYSAPFWLLLLAAVVARIGLPEFRAGRLLGILAAGAFGLFAVYHYAAYWKTYPVGWAAQWDDRQRYTLAGDWLRENLTPGDIVFTTNWDDPPILFYHAPQQRYLVFLDPMFMYKHDPARFRLWRAVSEGREANAAQIMRHEFGAAVLFTRGRGRLDAQLRATPGIDRVHMGMGGETIWLLRDPGPAPAAVEVAP